MTPASRAASPIRLLVLALAVAAGAWVIFTSIQGRGSGPIVQAIRASDPAIGDAAIEVERVGPFVESDGRRPYRRHLWCGAVTGLPDGSVAVVARRSRRGGNRVVESARAWDPALDSRGAWLLEECRRRSGPAALP